jgi:hypothetical protein
VFSYRERLMDGYCCHSRWHTRLPLFLETISYRHEDMMACLFQRCIPSRLITSVTSVKIYVRHLVTPPPTNSRADTGANKNTAGSKVPSYSLFFTCIAVVLVAKALILTLLILRGRRIAYIKKRKCGQRSIALSSQLITLRYLMPNHYPSTKPT